MTRTENISLISNFYTVWSLQKKKQGSGTKRGGGKTHTDKAHKNLVNMIVPTSNFDLNLYNHKPFTAISHCILFTKLEQSCSNYTQ